MSIFLLAFSIITCTWLTICRCETIKLPCDGPCTSSLTKNSCQQNEFIEIDSKVSCCPQCRGGLQLHQSGCDDQSKRCAPGLLCQNGVCVLDKGIFKLNIWELKKETKTFKMDNLIGSCSYTYHLPKFRQLPDCEVDGSFAAKQCKGDNIAGK